MTWKTVLTWMWDRQRVFKYKQQQIKNPGSYDPVAIPMSEPEPQVCIPVSGNTRGTLRFIATHFNTARSGPTSTVGSSLICGGLDHGSG